MRRCRPAVAAALLLLALGVSAQDASPASPPGGPASRAEEGPVSLLPLLTVGGGLLVLQAGGLVNRTGFELHRSAQDFWDRYVQSGARNEDLESAYLSRWFGYLGLEIGSYALWGAGAAAMSLGAFALPAEAFRLSPEGRYVFTVGMGLSLAGHVFAFSSGLQATKNDGSWDAYLRTGGYSEPLRNAYEAGYDRYVSATAKGAAFRLLGAAALAGSFYVPGRKTPVLQRPLDRLLAGAGIAAAAAGNVFLAASLNAKEQSEWEWEKYAAAGAPDDSELLDSYVRQYRRYLATALLAYGLWLGGGASVLTAVCLPLEGGGIGAAAGPDDATRPVELVVLPTASGVELLIRYRPLAAALPSGCR